MAQPTLRRPVAAGRPTVPTPAQHVDWLLVGSVIALAVLGIVMVFSATRGTPDQPTTFFMQRQALFVVLGIGLMALFAAIDYRHLRDWSVPAGLVLLGLLLMVLSPLGSESKGTQAWFELAGFQLQPSEPAKLALIVGLAAFCTFDRGVLLDNRGIVTLFGIAAVPMMLILMQPDVGTVLVFGAIVLGMALVAGARPRHFAVLALAAILFTVLVLNSGLLADYQTDRLTAFVNPEDTGGTAYNQGQSQIAIGAGGLSGEGLFDGSQTGLDFVPEQHTDFIFTVVGEELGFLGAALVLGLFGIVLWRTFRTAQTARDDFGTVLCAGVLAMFLFQIFQNVGMSTGIMPVTGIPLPFLSYGGSSTLSLFCAIGMVLSVHMRRFL